MKLFQFSCTEGNKVDMRQANAVSRYRPDIIIFEAPCNKKTPDLIYNKFSPSKKPLNELMKDKIELRKVSKKYLWVESDIYVYDNVASLWRGGHDVKMYNVDGPRELLRINLEGGVHWNPKPFCRGTHFIWWVRIYLREKIMTKNIEYIFSKNKNMNGLTVLMFLQKFHWINVKFQLLKPSKEKMFNYYFGSFKGLNPKNIGLIVKEENKELYKYWCKYSEFK